MRITLRETNSNLQFYLMKNYSKLSNLQEQIATGRRLNKPSDDPVDVTNDLGFREELKAREQYKRNIEDGIAFMGVTDTALVSMNSLMQRIKELGIQSSNDTYSAEERNYINQEVSQLLQQTITLIDSTYKGDYIFGGTNSKTPPYMLEQGTYTSAALVGSGTETIEDNSVAPPITTITDILPGSAVVTSGGVTFKEGTDYRIDYVNGTINRLAGGRMDFAAASTYNISFKWIKKADVPNTDSIIREIEKDVTSQINVSADQVFIDAENNTNVVDAIVSFGQALVQNNSNNIRTAITNIDYVFKNILAAQAENGARVNRFDLTQQRADQQIVEVTRLQSNLEDADMAEIVTEFSTLENIYNASLKAGASIIQPSLVNFL